MGSITPALTLEEGSCSNGFVFTGRGSAARQSEANLGPYSDSRENLLDREPARSSCGGRSSTKSPEADAQVDLEQMRE